MEAQLAESQAFTVTRIGGVLGARVEGLDLAAPLSDKTVADLRTALLEHCVLVFPNQGHLTPDQQIAFGKESGE